MIHVVRMRIADADDGRRERATTKNPQTCLFFLTYCSFFLSCREVETGSRLKKHCLRSLAGFREKRIDFARSEN